MLTEFVVAGHSRDAWHELQMQAPPSRIPSARPARHLGNGMISLMTTTALLYGKGNHRKNKSRLQLRQTGRPMTTPRMVVGMEVTRCGQRTRRVSQELILFSDDESDNLIPVNLARKQAKGRPCG
jgi:hypothetical protein